MYTNAMMENSRSLGALLGEIKPAKNLDLSIPHRAADALGVPVERITGPGCPDDKLMVIWIEAMLAGSRGVTLADLAEKYRMTPTDLADKMASISIRCRVEPHLKILISKLQREFQHDLES